MAFSATTVWEVNAAATGGDTSNGGGFDPANASMATDLAATLATGTAPVVTSASYNFITRDNSAYLFIKSGTNWIPGEYPITSTSGNAATLNAAVGAVRLWENGQFSRLNTVAGCATTASPTGGTWSVDYSQSTAAAVAFTDLVINGTTNTSFTSAGNPIGKNFVGNIISVTSGTGFTVQRIQIASVSGTTGTADKSLGTLSSTGGNGGLGGALASHTQANTSKAANNTVFVKAGTYAGAVNDGNSTLWMGYNTTRTLTNTDATRPLWQCSANSQTLFQHPGPSVVANIDFSANAHTSCTAYQGNGYGSTAYRCTATGFVTGFTNNWHSINFVDCYASTCTTGFAMGVGGYHGNKVAGCTAGACATGFSFNGPGTIAVDCLALNSTANAYAVSSGSTGCLLQNCTAYNSTSHNFQIATNANVLRNCVAYTTTGGSTYNYAITGGNLYTILQNCAGGNAATANTNGVDASTINSGFITLAADPFTAKAGGDYSLNTTAGGGALLRAAGAPGAFLGLATTTSYPDIGAVQSAATAAGASPVIGCNFIRGIGSAA